jgi:biotin carboxyl carrier protein
MALRRLPFLAFLLIACTAIAQDYGLPFQGRWFVMHAGDTPNVNHHMSLEAQWYGMDFAKVGGPGNRSPARAGATKIEDFYSWGEAVLSPVEGEVVAVVDTFPDNPLGTKDPANPTGNHVVIKPATSRFVFLAHFQKGSITVKPGDKVKRGQVLGKCGNSGNSDFPHVHMHVQDTAELNKGMGQNITFTGINVEMTGKQFDNVSWPLIRGLFVSNR